MGGVDPAGGYVLELLRSGRPVVTANKQLVARSGAELFQAAAAGGVQLRFEASVCAAIPVIKVLRESLIVTNVHRVLGIVNGTTNFILSAMEEGRSYGDALAEAQRLGFAEADPTEDVGGLDAAAKTAILATVAFGSRVPLEWVEVEGIEGVTADQLAAARALDMHVKLLGRATLVGDRIDVRVGPASGRRTSSARVRPGPVQRGDAPGRRDPRDHARGAWRRRHRDRFGCGRRHGLRHRDERHGLSPERPCLAGLRADVAGDLRRPSISGSRSRTGPACSPALRSISRTRTSPWRSWCSSRADGHAVLHVVTHEAPAGSVESALERDRRPARVARRRERTARHLGSGRRGTRGRRA